MTSVQSTFSPSSLNCFDNCPKQYHFRYVEKRKIETEGVEAFVGKRVHEILERLYRFVADGKVPSLERVLHRYHQLWEEQYDGERIRIVRSGTEASEYRANGVRCLTNYYRRHYPFDAEQTIGLEKPIRFQLDDEGRYAVRGIIDRVARTRDGVIEIHDFRTGRRVPRQAQLDSDRQLGLYELGLRSLGQTGEMRLVWHYALADRTRTSMRSPEQREELRDQTTAAIDRIRSESEWKPKQSGLCDWCEFRNLCPAFARERDAAGVIPMPEEPAFSDEPPGPASGMASAAPSSPPAAGPGAASEEAEPTPADEQLPLL